MRPVDVVTLLAALGPEASGSIGDFVLGVAALLFVLGAALYLGKRFDRLF